MADVVLRPGQTSLADWRAIYHGAIVTLDPTCHTAERAAQKAVEGNTRARRADHGIKDRLWPPGKRAHRTGQISPHSNATSCCRTPPVWVSRCPRSLGAAHDDVEPLGQPLGQGASGARLATVQFLAAMLSRGLLPVVPTQGSVGAFWAISRHWRIWQQR